MENQLIIKELSNNRNLNLLFSGDELTKNQIQDISKEFSKYFDGFDFNDEFCILHFGLVGELFIEKFLKLLNVKNKTENIITVDLYSLVIHFENSINI